jgi:hypothetical protein
MPVSAQGGASEAATPRAGQMAPNKWAFVETLGVARSRSALGAAGIGLASRSPRRELEQRRLASGQKCSAARGPV